MKNYLFIALLCVFSVNLFADHHNEKGSGVFIEDPELTHPDINIRIAAKFKKIDNLVISVNQLVSDINTTFDNLNTLIKNKEELQQCGVADLLISKINKLNKRIGQSQLTLANLTNDVENKKTKEMLVVLKSHRDSYMNIINEKKPTIKKLKCQSKLIVEFLGEEK